MDGNDKKLIDILKSIDESLKILAGRKSVIQSGPIKKSYKDLYFSKTEKGWEKKEDDNETTT